MFQGKRLVHKLIWLAGSGLILLLAAGCQAIAESKEPTPDEAVPGLLAELPSIDEIAGTPAPIIGPLPTLDPSQVSEGEQLYQIHCASCHGSNLEGEVDWQLQNEDGSFRAPPHDPSGHTWHHGDAVLWETVRQGGARLPANIGGTSNMPAFGEILTEPEIAAVLAFIKSSWPEDIQTIQREMSARER